MTLNQYPSHTLPAHTSLDEFPLDRPHPVRSVVVGTAQAGVLPQDSLFELNVVLEDESQREKRERGDSRASIFEIAPSVGASVRRADYCDVGRLLFAAVCSLAARIIIHNPHPLILMC